MDWFDNELLYTIDFQMLVLKPDRLLLFSVDKKVIATANRQKISESLKLLRQPGRFAQTANFPFLQIKAFLIHNSRYLEYPEELSMVRIIAPF
jgi:hypothetical protein